jgi:hypothetical protein
MTVSQLIEHLSALPGDVRVEVWVGPSGHEDREDVTLVEGLQDGEGKKVAVLWTHPIQLDDETA